MGQKPDTTPSRKPTRGHGPPRFAVRVERLTARLRAAGADALLVTNPRDIRYLTGFVGDDSWALVPARGKRITVLSDFRFREQIAREAPHVATRMRKAGLAEELAKVAEAARLGTIAFQTEYTSVALRKTLVKHLGAKRLTDAGEGLLAQRAVKDEAEVAAIEKALGIQERAFESLCETIEPGQSETEIAASLEYLMRSEGADGTSFPSIVAADANGSLPHAIPGPSKVRRGGAILIDFGARWGGYCSDLTRVVALGKMSPRMREVYRIVLDAQLAAIDAIAPGKTFKAVDGVARNLIKKAGYGKEFGHSLGHGIGLDIHEEPRLSARAEGQLEPGHVVTVEPGIYLPGVGGVRIEDDVLVTPSGYRVLSRLPKDLESAII